MRTVRSVAAALAGVAAGFVLAAVTTGWLRASVPEAGLVWNVVPAPRVAGWLVAAAHGVPIKIRTTAGLRSPGAAVGRLGDLVGGSSGRADVTFTFSIVLIPIALLAIVGIVVALVFRRRAPRSPRELVGQAAVCGMAYGAALAALSLYSEVGLGFSGRLAPQLGLDGATGRIAFQMGPRPVQALWIGGVWGVAFALAGGLSTPAMRAQLADNTRVLLRLWLRALGAFAAVVGAVLVVGAVWAVVAGRAPGGGRAAVGGWLLAGNAAAAGIVLAHGVPVQVALDAGPFAGWSRVALFHVGPGAGAAPAAAWAVLLLPAVVGVWAGRSLSRRTSLRPLDIGWRFGGLWGLTLAVLALLLRVRVLSSFSLGGIELGGGHATVDPLMAALAGAGWGAVSALAGAYNGVLRRSRIARPSAPAC